MKILVKYFVFICLILFNILEFFQTFLHRNTQLSNAKIKLGLFILTLQTTLSMNAQDIQSSGRIRHTCYFIGGPDYSKQREFVIEHKQNKTDNFSTSIKYGCLHDEQLIYNYGFDYEYRKSNDTVNTFSVGTYIRYCKPFWVKSMGLWPTTEVYYHLGISNEKKFVNNTGLGLGIQIPIKSSMKKAITIEISGQFDYCFGNNTSYSQFYPSIKFHYFIVE